MSTPNISKHTSPIHWSYTSETQNPCSLSAAHNIALLAATIAVCQKSKWRVCFRLRSYEQNMLLWHLGVSVPFPQCVWGPITLSMPHTFPPLDTASITWPVTRSRAAGLQTRHGEGCGQCRGLFEAAFACALCIAVGPNPLYLQPEPRNSPTSPDKWPHGGPRVQAIAQPQLTHTCSHQLCGSTKET